MSEYFDIEYKTRSKVENGILFVKDESDNWVKPDLYNYNSDCEVLQFVKDMVYEGKWKDMTTVIKDIPLKGYVFVHRGLSGMYAGIQAAHAMIRLVHNQYANPDMIDWVTVHETLVILDGGNSQNMDQISGILSGADNSMEYFREPDMDNMMTAIAYVPSADEASEIEFFKTNDGIGDSDNPVVNLLLKSRTHKG
ncbi:conserved hypothetical protein [Aeromonas phage 65]|uniref:Uncharacterized protein n=2 Tax=Ishigurovirus osborne TaxID=260149 RepID=A0A219YBR2_9CAUD|nr:hydrolase [Aeromonas phage 65]ADQ53066.1 conserved hypothetical protein [Aeromonas phage 65]APU01446.1 hypothetical protein [Aeromonas phage 65.2]